MSTTVKELPADATTEQIQTFVGEIVAEENKERAETSEMTNSGTTTSKKTPVDDDDETPVVDDAVAEKEGDEDREETSESESDWREDPEVKDLVSTLGVTPDKLAGFSSREELDRAVGLLDAAALSSGRKAGEQATPVEGEQQQVQQSGQRPRGRDGKFIPADKADESAGEAQGDFPQLDPDQYDEGMVKWANGLRSHYEGRLKHLDERFSRLEQVEQHRATIAAERQFDSDVDSLGHPEIFGVAGKETPKELENRKKLFAEREAYLIGLSIQRRRPADSKSTTNRVAQMVFADAISKKQHKQLTQKISRQSNMRMGGSVTKPTDHKYSGSVENDPKWDQMFAELNKAE